MTYCSYIIHIESCSLLNKILRQLPSYRRENYSDLIKHRERHGILTCAHVDKYQRFETARRAGATQSRTCAAVGNTGNG